MRAAPDRLPVTLLSGFLGSGKTSLLARLLRDPDLVDTAVIVNEFGEIGLDHLLIAPGSEEVLLLDAGCLCCTMQDSLADTLADLFHRRVRAEVPAFKRVVIETTGLAHPGPILRQLLTDRSITAHYALDGLVTTIDALHGARQLDAHPQALQQAAMADRLVVTKTDLTEGGVPTALAARLRRLNPGAPILVAVHGAIAAAELLGSGKATRRLDIPATTQGHGDDRIRARSIALESPVRWVDYAAWLDALRALPAENLLRVKGLIAIEGDPRPYVVQGVQHDFSSPERLPAWPTSDRRGHLVLITCDLDPARLDRALDALRRRAEID